MTKSTNGTKHHTFLAAAPNDNVPVKVSAAYDGPVPSETCDYLARRIIGCAKDGFCYPASPMDVYGDIWCQIEKTARNLPPLETAAVTTYLRKAVDNALRKYFARRIKPLRDEYRATEGRIEKADEEAAEKEQRDAPEGKDVGYAAYAAAAEGGCPAGNATSQPLTIQQLANKLRSEETARERRMKAAFTLEEVYEALLAADRKVAVCAFRAYVEANGNMLAAAKIAGIGKTTFYALWPHWLEAARDCMEMRRSRSTADTF